MNLTAVSRRVCLVFVYAVALTGALFSAWVTVLVLRDHVHSSQDKNRIADPSPMTLNTFSPTLVADNISLVRWTQDMGSPRIDLSINRTALSVGGQSFKHGIGTHANSTLCLNLAEGVKRLTGACGVDDSVPVEGAGSIKCIVRAGDRILFQTPTLRSGMPARYFSLDITGISEIELVVTDASEDSSHDDHADWVDLKAE